MWETNTDPLAAKHGIKRTLENSDNLPLALAQKSLLGEQTKLENGQQRPDSGSPRP